MTYKRRLGLGSLAALAAVAGSSTRGYGGANTASRAPMGLGLRVRIASITKTFTATAVLLPVQRGRLSLSDKLSHWVKGIPNGRLSSNSSTPTLAIFATLAQKLYPSSLKKK